MSRFIIKLVIHPMTTFKTPSFLLSRDDDTLYTLIQIILQQSLGFILPLASITTSQPDQSVSAMVLFRHRRSFACDKHRFAIVGGFVDATRHAPNQRSTDGKWRIPRGSLI